jgi:hypothetical protein
VGIATGTVTVPETESVITESESATTSGVDTVSVGTTVDRGNVMLGTNEVGGTVLVADTDELEYDWTDSGIARDGGMSDGKLKDKTFVDVRLPTIKSRPRLYPFLTISCPNSIGSSTEAL